MSWSRCGNAFILTASDVVRYRHCSKRSQSWLGILSMVTNADRHTSSLKNASPSLKVQTQIISEAVCPFLKWWIQIQNGTGRREWALAWFHHVVNTQLSNSAREREAQFCSREREAQFEQTKRHGDGEGAESSSGQGGAMEIRFQITP